MSTMEEMYPDIETWCRLCLKEHKDAHSIFSEDNTQLSIQMRLMACLSLEAKPTDGLPKMICCECRYQLEKSFLFRQRSQAADKKLRKHNRLVSMGKKSRVFAKTLDNDSDEDELEFEESIDFINKLENIREESTFKWRKECKQELEKEFADRLDSARKEIRNVVRMELMEEVRNDVRSQLQDEVQVEIRKEQIGQLLAEIEVFLAEKKASHSDALVELPADGNEKNHTPPTATAEAPLPTPAAILTTEKRLTRKRTAKTSEALAAEYGSRSKVEIFSATDTKLNTTATDTADSFNDMVDDGDMVTTKSGEIYIINAVSAGNSRRNSSTEFQQDKSITSYNIQDNGDIQYTDTKSEDLDDVMVFDLDEGGDQQLYELNENVIILSNEKANSDVLTLAKGAKSDFVVKQKPRDSQPNVGRVSDTLKTFQCQLCPIAFATEKMLSRHLSTHIKTLKSGTGGSLKCPVCELQLSCASSLKRHIIIHTGLKPYKCEECELSFSQREVLKRHMDTHTGAKRHRCPHCDNCFAQKTNLQQHINRMHTGGESQHKCHLCNRSFSHVSGLSRHLVIHAGVTYSCKECGRRFNDRSAVHRHVQNVHKRKVTGGDSGTEGNKNEEEYIIS